MSNDGMLHLDLVDLSGDRIQDPVDLELSHRRLADRRRVVAADASKTLVIPNLHRTPEGIYKLRVQAPSYRPLQRFVRIAAGGVTKLRLVMGSAIRTPRRRRHPQMSLGLQLDFDSGDVPKVSTGPCDGSDSEGVVSRALDLLRDQEGTLMDWLRADAENPRSFADDPLTALQSARLAIPQEVLDDLRIALPRHNVEQTPPGIRLANLSLGVVPPAGTPRLTPSVAEDSEVSDPEADMSSGGKFVYRLEVAVEALNQQLEKLFEGGLYPEEAALAFARNPFQGVFQLNLGSPKLKVSDFDRVDLILPFSDSSVALFLPTELAATGLGGNVQITCKMRIDCIEQQCSAVLDLANGIVDSTLFRNPAWDSRVVVLGGAATLVQGWLLDAVVDFLRTEIRALPLSGVVPIAPRSPEAAASALTGMATRAIPEDEDGTLLYLFTTGNDRPGDPSSTQRALLPPGFSAAVSVSSPFLLHQFLCPLLAEALDISADERAAAFEFPCRLVESQPLRDGFKLTELEAAVVAGEIQIKGKAKRSGKGWKAEGEFTFTLRPVLADGEITWISSEVETESKLEVKWWAYLLAGLTGGLAGIVVLGVAHGITDSVFESKFSDKLGGILGGGLADFEGTGAGSEGQGGLFGAATADLVAETLSLDTQFMTLAGSLAPVMLPNPPLEEATDDLVLAPGQTLDFERRRVISPTSPGGLGGFWRAEAPGFDIAWTIVGGMLAVEARNGAEILNLRGASLSDEPGPRAIGTTLGAVDVPRTIPYSMIPLGLHVTDPVAWENLPSSVLDPEPLILDLRTGKNNFVSAEIWRDPWNMLYVQYQIESTIPDLDLTLSWQVYDRKTAGEGIDRWTDSRFEVQQRPTSTGTLPGHLTLRSITQEQGFEQIAIGRLLSLRATPRRIAYPLSYRWYLGDQTLEAGDGEVMVDASTRVRYRVNHDLLQLWSDRGQDLECEVTAEVRDPHGRQVCVGRRIELVGVVKVGGRAPTYGSPQARGALVDLLGEQFYETPGGRLRRP